MSNPPSDWYVDPSIAGNSGTGIISDPYGDIQYALDQVGTSPGQDTTDGDRFNILAGTAESLAASLSLATYGTPGAGGPLIFQGYTSAQGDGGVGAIDLNGNTLFSTDPPDTLIYDMDLSDGPAADAMWRMGADCVASRLYAHDSDGHGLMTVGTACQIVNVRVEDVGDDAPTPYYGLEITGNNCLVYGCYIKAGATRNMSAAIHADALVVPIVNNIISIDGPSSGVVVDGNFFPTWVVGNTIFSDGGTGHGIDVTSILGPVSLAVLNNYVEGFSGASGIGINVTQDSIGGGIYGHNALFNNATNENFVNELFHALGDNEVLSATGLAKTGSDTFANRLAYFAAMNGGNMKKNSYPGLHAKGAVQRVYDLAMMTGAGNLVNVG